MLNLNSPLDLCDFLYCPDLSAIYIGNIRDTDELQLVKDYDTFARFTAIYDNNEIKGEDLSDRIYMKYSRYNRPIILFCDFNEDKYVTTSLDVCHAFCALFKCVVICPIVTTAKEKDIRHNILPKLLSYDNLIIRPVFDCLEASNATYLNALTDAMASCEYGDDTTVDEFLHYLSMELVPALPKDSENTPMEIEA